MSVSNLFCISCLNLWSLFLPPRVLVCPCFGLTLSLFFSIQICYKGKNGVGGSLLLVIAFPLWNSSASNIHAIESLFLFCMGM